MSRQQDRRLDFYFKTVDRETIPSLSPGVVILGYPDDEGVRNGDGRSGSSKGPQAIRQELACLTPHLEQPIVQNLFDIGDVAGPSVKARHDEAHRLTSELLKVGHRIVALGGGHDYGYPDGLALCQVFSSKAIRPLVINFDAHFDMRDLQCGITSGTPFYRLLESGEDFDHATIGVQAHCNSQQDLSYAIAKKTQILTMDDWLSSRAPLQDYVFSKLSHWLTKDRPTYLSLDMDVFSASSAPGVSAPQPLGLSLHEFYPLYLRLLKQLDVRLLGVYETAPQLDGNGLTAKLAAQLVHRFLFTAKGNRCSTR